MNREEGNRYATLRLAYSLPYHVAPSASRRARRIVAVLMKSSPAISRCGCRSSHVMENEHA